MTRRRTGVESGGSGRDSKLARRIARRIEAEIIDRGWPVGETFASETELRTSLGVSQAVVREAVRLVEHHGVAAMRRGPHGGLVIRAPDAAPLTAAVVVYLEHVGTSVQDLLDVRVLIEPMAAHLATEHMDESDIAMLRASLADERRRGTLSPSDRDRVHSTIGKLCGNPALSLFIDVLCALTTRYASVPPPLNPQAASELSSISDHAHDKIVHAIVAGNTAAAERSQVRHLEGMRTWLLSIAQAPISNGGPPRGGPTSGEKMAEHVARLLIAEIASSGLQPGEILGSETELQARFGVGRAVFRESVRLLEYHSVAMMRRGPSGGLAVTRPDPTASIDAMTIYLEYSRVRSEHLRVVRSAIELGALDTLARRDDGVTAMSALRNTRCLVTSAYSTDAENRPSGFHLELVRLADNPILGLFEEIMLTVGRRHSEHEPSTASADLDFDRVHEAIIDAFVSGDSALARRRLSEHLRDVDHHCACQS